MLYCTSSPRFISIHAPREGSDLGTVPVLFELDDFYPRSPRGERPFLYGLKSVPSVFLSTLPARGATNCCGRTAWRSGNFYPRSPRGERQDNGGNTNESYAISIHAPREGSDRKEA